MSKNASLDRVADESWARSSFVLPIADQIASREHHEYDTGPDAGIEAIRGRIETGREGVAP